MQDVMNGGGATSAPEAGQTDTGTPEPTGELHSPTLPMISAPAAVFLGWCPVAVWNALDIARRQLQPRGGRVRLMHHLTDLAHVLAVALVMAAGTALWVRFGPKRRAWALLPITLVAALVGQVLLSEDLSGAVDRLGRWGEMRGALAVACALVALAIPASFALGRACARLRLRSVGALLALALIAANALLLIGGYPGIHVLMSSCGAVLMASTLSGAEVGARWLRPAKALRLVPSDPPTGPATRAQKTRRALGWLTWLLLAACASASIVFKPSSRVLVELEERDTPLLLPWVRNFYAPSSVGEVKIPMALRGSFEKRNDRKQLPPASERLLPPGPIVLVVTIDALRLEVFESVNRKWAPNLQEIRKNSVYFSQARSSGSDTRFSLATLFTGRHYCMLKWNHKNSKRPTLANDKVPRLPELLQQAKVQTTTAIALPEMLVPKIGIVRGFDEEFYATPELAGPRTNEIIDQAIARLRRQGPEPLFFYTHLIDPHLPYYTYGKQADTNHDAYLMEVALADAAVGRLRRAVRELGLAQRTALIIGSDHGEGFGEHGVHAHNKTLYEIMVHVPLMFELPGMKPKEVSDFVSLMDIAPTVLDLFGAPKPGYWMSESLMPFLTGGRGDPKRLILMEKRDEKAMVFPDGLKVLTRGAREEIYDIRRDPTETNNLRDALGDDATHRVALLKAYLDVHCGTADPRAAAEPEDDQE